MNKCTKIALDITWFLKNRINTNDNQPIKVIALHNELNNMYYSDNPVSFEYFKKIISNLSKWDIIRIKRGTGGGVLYRTDKTTSIADICRAFGDLPSFSVNLKSDVYHNKIIKILIDRYNILI